MEENIEHLKDKLKSKQKELEDYVLDINNNYLSEEAEQMRKEIYDLHAEINKRESNYNSAEEDIKILEEYINSMKRFDLLSDELERISAIENLIKGYRKLLYKLEEKICFEGHQQYKELLNDLEDVLNQVLNAFENNWCIDWNFTEIREKYEIKQK